MKLYRIYYRYDNNFKSRLVYANSPKEAIMILTKKYQTIFITIYIENIYEIENKMIINDSESWWA